MKKIRFIALITAILMVSSVAAGCSKSGTGDGSSSKSDTGSSKTESTATDESRFNPPGTFPIIKEKVSLTMGLVQDTNIEDRKTNLYTKALEENVNVDLSFEEFPAAPGEAKQKLSILISSDSKLPDIINMGLSDIETYTYGSQGYFIALDDYLENSSTYIKKRFDKEKYDKYLRSADGNVYAIPRIIEEVGNDWSYRQWINKTWLDKVGMDIPETTEEYYQALKAFKEEDPNGNNKRDEIPLIGSTNGWNSKVYPTLMNAFIYSNPDNQYLIAQDGKIDIAYRRPEWKEGLEYMNKLCKEELLSPLTFTQDVNQLKTIIEDQDSQLVGSLMVGSMSVYVPESKRKEDMTHLPPLKGPNGAAYATRTIAGLPEFAGFITKDCKDPEAAFKLLDYMWDEDMAKHGRYGAKDIDYKDPAPGVGVGLYEESLGYKPVIEYITSIWGVLQNSHWGEVHPSFRSYEVSGGQLWNNNPYDSQYMTAQSVPHYMDKGAEEQVLKIIYLPEEIDEIADIITTLTTYREEMAVAFITGNKPFSEWDAYIKELGVIGIDNYLEITQKAYDRMK